MSGNFEVVPCGTLQRLAAVEAERNALREILDHIPQVEAELAETSDKLHAVEAERDALLADILFQLLEAANYIDALGGDSKSYRVAIAIAKVGGGNG